MDGAVLPPCPAQVSCPRGRGRTRAAGGHGACAPGAGHLGCGQHPRAGCGRDGLPGVMLRGGRPFPTENGASAGLQEPPAGRALLEAAQSPAVGFPRQVARLVVVLGAGDTASPHAAAAGDGALQGGQPSDPPVTADQKHCAANRSHLPLCFLFCV